MQTPTTPDFTIESFEVGTEKDLSTAPAAVCCSSILCCCC